LSIGQGQQIREGSEVIVELVAKQAFTSLGLVWKGVMGKRSSLGKGPGLKCLERLTLQGWQFALSKVGRLGQLLGD
jgi:hypothetical protein